jgi:hypothetical protein
MIKYQSYNLNNKIILTNEVLNTYIIKFWEDVFSPIIESSKGVKHLMIICKVKYSDNGAGGYKTIGPLRRVNFNDQELFSDYLQERLGILIDSYQPLTISEIIFSYIIKDGEVKTSDRLLLEDLSNEELPFHEFNRIKLPISMYPEDYGIIQSSVLMEKFTRVIVSDNKRVYRIDVSLDGLVNNVTILGLSDFKWTDTNFGEGFKREIGKTTLHFIDGEIVLQKQQLNAKTFRKLRNKF